MKIPRKYSPIVFAFFMALIFPFVITFFIILINVGFSNDFISRWMKSYGIIVLIAFPTILIISPLIRKLVARITD